MILQMCVQEPTLTADHRLGRLTKTGEGSGWAGTGGGLWIGTGKGLGKVVTGQEPGKVVDGHFGQGLGDGSG